MRTEEQTPIEQRFLWIEGKVSEKSLKLIEAGLPKVRLPNVETLFVGFAYADLPLGKSFQVMFPRGQPEAGIYCESKIIAVTQQWGKPFNEVPDGYKTICIIQFSQGVPEMVCKLPTVDAWYVNRDYICVCDEQTWEALKSRQSVSV